MGMYFGTVQRPKEVDFALNIGNQKPLLRNVVNVERESVPPTNPPLKNPLQGRTGQ